MGYAQISQSMASNARALSEQSLFQKSEINRVSLEGSLAPIINKDKEAINGEVDESISTSLSKYYDLKSAEFAETAALAGMISSIAKAGASVAGGFANKKAGKGSNFDILQTVVQAGMSVAGAIVAFKGTQAEKDILQQQVGELSAEVKIDQANVTALTGNPAI